MFNALLVYCLRTFCHGQKCDATLHYLPCNSVQSCCYSPASLFIVSVTTVYIIVIVNNQIMIKSNIRFT